MNILYLITARGGSKGIPKKNTKHLNNIPLVAYSIKVAQELSLNEDICVSTDDPEIISISENEGLSVPFVRPAEISTDTASSDSVIMHALNYYENLGKNYDTIILLQPTSPFRKVEHVKEALALFTGKEDMIISVSESKSNPYFNLLEEDENAYLHKSKKLATKITRRQDAPKVYEANGAIYIIKVESFKKFTSLSAFEKVKKYLMKDEHSLDLDTEFDWMIAELMIKKQA